MKAAQIAAPWGNAGNLVSQLCDQKEIGHAYLLVGPANSAKTDAAMLLANAAVSRLDQIGPSDLGRPHPDIHRLEPQSATGYLVGQIREMLDDVQLSPICSPFKVYMMAEAQLLTSSSANALLKSLEEPPADTVFILLATSADAVLPTIVSRCQTIRFPARSQEQTVADLCASTGQTEQRCRAALAFCADTQQATQYLGDETKWAMRDMALKTLAGLASRDDVWAMSRAAALVDAATASTQSLQDAQEAEYDQAQAILSATALKEVKERHKRALTAATRSGIMAALRAQRALLRDALLMQNNPAATPACIDFADAVTTFSRLSQEALLSCIETIGRAMRRVEKNTLPRLAVEGMLLELKETLTCRP